MNGSSTRCVENDEAVETAYADYEFGRVAHLLYDAIWSEYCDWYLEMAKIALGPDAPGPRRAAAWRTLAWVLDRYLRLLHPLMPHVTEEIWGRLPHLPEDPELLIVAPWPMNETGPKHGSPADAHVVGATRADGVASLIELVSAIRAARAEAAIQPAEVIEAKLWFQEGPVRAAFADLEPVVERLARVRTTVEPDRRGLDDAAGCPCGHNAVRRGAADPLGRGPCS